MGDSVSLRLLPLGLFTNFHSSTLLSASLSPLGLDCAELLVLSLDSDIFLIFLFFFFAGLDLDRDDPRISAFKSNHLLMISQKQCYPSVILPVIHASVSKIEGYSQQY